MYSVPQLGGFGGGDVQSMREALDPLTVVAKTHSVEWFSGDGLDSIWSTIIDGSGSITMNDNIDGGLSILTGTASNNDAAIYYNNIRHYDPAGSVLIGIATNVTSTTNINHEFFLTNTVLAYCNFIKMQANAPTQCFYVVSTDNACGNTTVVSSIAIDQAEHLYKLQLTSSSGLMWIDGVLEATSTATLPISKLQPSIKARTRTAAAREWRCRYLECYNT